MATTARILVSPAEESHGWLPEGPRSFVFKGCDSLVWVNIQHNATAKKGSIFVRDWETGEISIHEQPARPGFVLPTDQPDCLFVGREKELGILNVANGKWESLALIPDGQEHTIINDGEVEPGGHAVVFGTKDVRFKEPIAHLYRYSMIDHRITFLADQQLCSNGKVFHQDHNGLILYDIDTPKKTVVKYRYDTEQRRLHDEGVSIDLNDEPAFPDGMIDVGDGSVIIAFFNPHSGGDGVTRRYRLGSNAIVEEWITPGSPRVTCPLLVERERRVQLVLTTAVEGMTAEIRSESPNAGALFIADTSLTALPDAELVQTK